MILDPETKIYQQLVQLLNASKNFTDAVTKIENMTDPAFVRFKQEIQVADTPLLAIVPSLAQITLSGRNSLTAEFNQTFRLVLVMDDLKLPPMSYLKHVIVAVLSLAGPDLGIPGLVRTITMKNAKDDAFGPKDWTRSTVRFMAILDLDVNYYLDSASLMNFAA